MTHPGPWEALLSWGSVPPGEALKRHKQAKAGLHIGPPGSALDSSPHLHGRRGRDSGGQCLLAASPQSLVTAHTGSWLPALAPPWRGLWTTSRNGSCTLQVARGSGPAPQWGPGLEL